MKTSTADSDANVKLWIDDTDGTEESQAIPVINDGNWHKYSWDLANYNGTTITTGNGKIDGATVTLDAIVLSQANTSNTWTLFIDDVQSEIILPGSLKMTNVEKTWLLSGGEINIYPNPNDGLFTIDFEDKRIDGYDVEVINVSSSKIFTKRYTGNHQNIDLSFLPDGLYFVNIKGGDYRRTLKLLIKR
jgi:hypothetical protein